MEANEVTTGEVRLSYVHLTKPYSVSGKEDEAKYSVTCMLPKSDVATKARIDAAVDAAKQHGLKNKWDGVAPPNLPTPVWDGDGVRADGTPFGPEFKGCWVFTVSSKDRPEIVDASLNPIINASDIYSGMYARVNFRAFAYKYGGKKGIGFGLGPVQKTRDGEVLGGARTTAAAAFGAPVQTDANGFMQAPALDPFTGQPLN